MAAQLAIDGCAAGVHSLRSKVLMISILKLVTGLVLLRLEPQMFTTGYKVPTGT